MKHAPVCELLLLWCLLVLQSKPAYAQEPETQDAGSAQSGTPRTPRRAPVDIRDPQPDSPNFPNSAYTIGKGRVYIENSPGGFLFGARPLPNEYQWLFLIRYGVTERIEFRVFSNGLTSRGRPVPVTGFAPLAFDVKVHLWDERKKYFIPSVGSEIYVQTDLGSQAFDGGTFPSVNVLVDHSLPGRFTLEYNIGATREQTPTERSYYLTFPWSLSREIVDDLDLFVQGFFGSATIPRFQHSPGSVRAPTNALGAGTLWTLNSRVAVWGSFAFGATQRSPSAISLGFAVAF